MLLSIVKEFEAAQSRLGVNPYGAWSATVRQLRSDWEKGERADVRQLRDYLEDVPSNQRSEALQDLIAEHLQLAWRDGVGTNLQPYLAEFGCQFEELGNPAMVPTDLIEDEFLARYNLPHGDTPSMSEYQTRFHCRPDVTQMLRRRHLDQGRYVKLDELGRGAMGVVFKAFDHNLGRLVAIKQPKPGLANFTSLQQRFAAEARLTARLEHPNIVSIHEYVQGEYTPFCVMRLVIGQPMSDQIREFHQPPVERSRKEQKVVWSQLLQMFVRVCEAISYAHSQGVLHCDLKPDNVIIGQFGETAILDWGLARPIPFAVVCSKGCASAANAVGDESVNMVVGTPQYMPPEQLDGISDARSDVFGLGTILYEILTANSPHWWPEGSRPANWTQIVREAHFPPPRRLKPQMPRALEAICLKATARSPEDRYQNAAELNQDVQRYLAGESVTVQVNRWQRWIERFQLKRKS